MIEKGESNETMSESYENPNIFNFATSELSQDAMFAWIISWADDRYYQIDAEMCKLGKNFLSLLTNMPASEIKQINVRKQWEKIDICVEINDDSFLAIEDKTSTTIHDDQLIRYKEIVENEYNGKRSNLLYAYLKIENERKSILEEVKKAGYKSIKREDILSVLNSYKGQNLLILDYRKHLQYIEDCTNSYIDKAVDKWGWYEWQGFYTELDKHVTYADWDYVPNQNGGFVGLFGVSHKNDEVGIYIQFEQNKVCVKLECGKDADKTAMRQKYHDIIVSLSDKYGITIEKPNRFGHGITMTIGVVPENIVFGEDKIDMSIIKTIYDKLDELIEEGAKIGCKTIG